MNNKRKQKVPWRIYYDDGTTFDPSMGKSRKCQHCNGTGSVTGVNDAPKEGVVAINSFDDTFGCYTSHGYNMYYLEPYTNQWFGSDDEETMIRRLQGLVIGRMVSRKRLGDILNKASNDPDFPTIVPKRRLSDADYSGNYRRQRDFNVVLRRMIQKLMVEYRLDQEEDIPNASAVKDKTLKAKKDFHKQEDN